MNNFEEFCPGCASGGLATCEAPDMVADIEAFHKKFGLEHEGKPRALPPALARFREKFMREELTEYETASEGIERSFDGPVAEQLEDQLDALVDLVYVAIGTAYLHGFNFNEAWRRVHAANMKKVRATSAEQSKRGSASDVIKQPGWTPPCHRDLVEDHE